ncbi:MAG: M20/M25/M40 family metallo-hydrolase, partial [Candidatus Micrarchaeota archaeon]|nr:M20/M25/M40 family metallo-hydrolase [Candidatus Micrarchaeota archaeon]
MEVDQILGKLVSIKSSFGNEKAIGAYLESYLKEMGFKTKRQYFEKERFNVFAERGLGSKSMLLYGHFDTVPQYGDWQTNPYRLTRKSDRLYGLGAFDMKGGIAAMLKGLEQESNMKIKVLLCGDEENISKGAWHAVIKSRRWFDDVQFAIAGEAGVTHENDGGIGIVTLGRRGRCVITIDVEGISSHGAEPERGLSALDQAAKIATTANEIMTRTSNKLGSESIFINEIHSSSTSLSVPDRAYLNIDIHLVPPSTPEEATLRIEKHVKSLI